LTKLEGRAAAAGQDAAPMAEACGGERAPDGHNPEVVLLAWEMVTSWVGTHRRFASPRIFPLWSCASYLLNQVIRELT